MTKTIGIDVGTSNSAAAAMIGGKATIIPSAEGTSLGGKAFPSYVACTKDGQKLVEISLVCETQDNRITTQGSAIIKFKWDIWDFIKIYYIISWIIS